MSLTKWLIGLSLFVFVCPCITISANETKSNTFEIEAWAFDRGNFAVFQDQYRNGGPIIIANGNATPATVEYDIPFPVPGTYKFSVLAAMREVRPLTFFFNDVKIGQICTGSQTTPTWNSCDAQWDAPVELTVSDVERNGGMQTLKLIAENGPPPHLATLKFELIDSAAGALPADWSPNRPKAKTLPPTFRDHPGYVVPNAAAPNVEAMRRAINDLCEIYGDKYSNGELYLKLLEKMVADPNTNEAELDALRRQAILFDNPALDFETLLFIRRNPKRGLGFPANWQSNSSLPKSGCDDTIMAVSVKHPELPPTTFYKPPRDTMITDLDLHFDGERLMFSAVGENNRWHIFETNTKWPADSTPDRAAKQLTKGDADVDFYDSCYLPDGRIIVTCTAPMIGVPCVAGGSHVANLFLFDLKDGSMRQLCFDQEHNWCPTMLNSGRVMYTRWEYADTPHSNTRLLFQCNPDGTMQLEYYGSNSYWPTSIFFARAIPNHPTQVVGVVSGHHDNGGRQGELVILDPAISRHEAEGAVQRMPGGFGKKVDGPVVDGLTRQSWPKFAHPYPVTDKYFIVAGRLDAKSPYGLYLVDIFDNMILIKEMPGYALLEPTPLRKTTPPPVIPDRVDLARDDAVIFVSDVYHGPGLKDIPRGTVKTLKVFTYHYSYHGVGGLLGTVGQDGPWDVRGVLGTVPVESDGSACFRVPANLPIGVLPLDEHGQALQLMRSWMTAMPGENLQCNGCHEPQNSTPPHHFGNALALQRQPSEIKPFNTPAPDGETLLKQLNVVGFSFKEKVQPILDSHCIVCHNGEWEKTVRTEIVNNKPVGTSLDGKPFPIDLRGVNKIDGWRSDIAGSNWIGQGGQWSVGYDNLQRFVRRAGIESDYHLLSPNEYTANTTELVQILRNGHYDVQLSDVEWETLITWIDMNTPYHGNWGDITGSAKLDHIAKRRIELADMYGGESIPFENSANTQPVSLPQTAATSSSVTPNASSIAQNELVTPENMSRLITFRQPSPKIEVTVNGRDAYDFSKTRTLVVDQFSINLAAIPSGRIVKQSPDAKTELTIDRPFLIGTHEITNAQFRQFDPTHDSGIESRQGYQFGRRGYDVNDDDLPVVRVSWQKAKAYCKWLSEKTGKKVDLPTQEQWEFACRAGTTTPFWYGDVDTDFSPFENLGDKRLKEFVACTTFANYNGVRIIDNPNPFDDRVPKDERFDDGAFLHVPGGRYQSNPFGLFDMHGNVAELTSVTNGDSHEIIVMGGSWYDRPYRSTSDTKRKFQDYQPMFNVGFRIVVNE